MSEWDDAFDEDATADDTGGDDDSAGEERPDTVALLKQLAAAGGDLGRLASELLVARDEREAKAQAEAEALELLATDAPDLSLAEIQEALRIEVRQKDAETDARVLADTAAVMRKQGYGEGTIAERMEQLKAEQAATQELTRDSDPLHSHPLWQAHELRVWERERAEQLAHDMKANRPGAWELAVEDAQVGMDQTVDAVLAGTR